jgi:stress response protein YsnF
MRQRAPSNLEFGQAEHVIPVPREELQIGKRQVMSSKAFRVRTTVKEVPVEEHVDLRTESVVIERRPSTSPPGSDAFQESLVEVHEMHEEPVVAKVVRQGEEVVISKAVGTRRATIRDVVRETHVEVDGETGHEAVEPEPKRELAQLDTAADKPGKARSQTRAEPTKNRR